MAQTYKKMNIDINAKPTDIVTAVQKDAQSRYLDISLLDNGLALNLTGHEVRIYGKKPDGTEFYNDGVITNATTGRCQFELTSQALSSVGIVEVQVLLFKDNTQILSTHPFTINVVKSLMSDGAIESSNEYGALVVLYQNLYEAYDLMTEMIQKIGVPEAIAKSLGLNTMFEVWDWLIDYMQKNSSAGLVDKVDAIKLNTDINNAINKAAGADGTFSRTAFEYNDIIPVSAPNVSKAHIICKFIAPVSGFYKYTAKRHYLSSGEKAYICRVITDPSKINLYVASTSGENYYINKNTDYMVSVLYGKSIGSTIDYKDETYAKGGAMSTLYDFFAGREVLVSSTFHTHYFSSSLNSLTDYFHAQKGEIVMFVGIPYDNTSKQNIYQQKITY